VSPAGPDNVCRRVHSVAVELASPEGETAPPLRRSVFGAGCRRHLSTLSSRAPDSADRVPPGHAGTGSIRAWHEHRPSCLHTRSAGARGRKHGGRESAPLPAVSPKKEAIGAPGIWLSPLSLLGDCVLATDVRAAGYLQRRHRSPICAVLLSACLDCLPATQPVGAPYLATYPLPGRDSRREMGLSYSAPSASVIRCGSELLASSHPYFERWEGACMRPSSGSGFAGVCCLLLALVREERGKTMLGRRTDWLVPAWNKRGVPHGRVGMSGCSRFPGAVGPPPDSTFLCLGPLSLLPGL